MLACLQGLSHFLRSFCRRQVRLAIKPVGLISLSASGFFNQAMMLFKSVEL